jgi:putative intracellular protease/amidase/uncharacterized protein (DUF952 family)
MRWLFHALHARDLVWGPDGRYAPQGLAREGFLHASYRDVLEESVRLYFPPGSDVRVLAIDPRRLDVPVEVATTPRGPMPHIHGSLPADAVRVLPLEGVRAHADRVAGTRIAFGAFSGMTLLDLVGPLDALSRIASMGFDPTSTCEVIALTEGDDVWTGAGATFRAASYRPALDAFDVVVIPGGPNTRALVEDATLAAYLASYPHNRLLASVCTGALLLGAAGRLRGRRATTHASALDQLTQYGAVVTRERIVDEGNLVTAGGVTAGIDLGIFLVQRLEDEDVARAIAERMELR